MNGQGPPATVPPSSSNAQALPTSAYTAPYSTGANGILCQANISLNKTGSLMVAAPEPSGSSAPQNVTVTMQGGELPGHLPRGASLMRATSIFRRVIHKWQHRVTNTPLRAGRHPRRSANSDGGSGPRPGVALLAGFAVSISASSEHRNIASLDSSTRIAANQAVADVQQEAQANVGQPNNPFACPTPPFTPTFGNLTGFHVTPTVAYWNGTTWQPSPCVATAPFSSSR